MSDHDPGPRQAKSKRQKRAAKKANKLREAKIKEHMRLAAREGKPLFTDPTRERLGKLPPDGYRREGAAGLPGVKHYRVKLLDCLDYYHNRGLLREGNREPFEEQTRRYRAGLKIREDFDRTGLQASVVASYADTIKGASIEAEGVEGLKLDSVGFYLQAIRAVGPIADRQIFACAVMGEPVGAWELGALRRGLSVLADHYEKTIGPKWTKNIF